MRTGPNDHIWNLWNSGGDFIGGEGATHGRVTVERGWRLRKSAGRNISGYDKGPIRWFQRSNNSQTETEIQNVRTINIDTTIDSDAATCKIVILNQRMEQNDSEASLANPPPSAGESVGQPGFFWPSRGDNSSALLRWGQYANQWNDVLQPNALIRTYQGYGGKTKSIGQALTDGNLLLTGVWLVDEVTQDARSGDMTISCRDMGKLLIEQMLYPPLVPVGKKQSVHYPINYSRWSYINHPVIPYGITVYHTGYQKLYNKLTTPSASSHFNNGTVSHPGANSIDGENPSTFWMSAGRVNQGIEYIEYDIIGTAEIGGINIMPYGGNYELYVSLYAGGWLENPDYLDLQTPPAGPINAVMKQGVGWERAATIDLGGPYPNVTKVRLTFAHLAKVGPNLPGGPLRAGIRDLSIGQFTKTISGGDRIISGIFRADNDNTNGYWIVGSDGGVYAFGDVGFYGSVGGRHLNGEIVGIAGNPVTGKGYRLVGKDGGVFDYGDLYFHGSLPGDEIVLAAGIEVVDIENGDNGYTGYYLLRNNGIVDAYGSAVWHGNHSGISNPNSLLFVSGMAVKQTQPHGYWTISTDGNIQAHGDAEIKSLTGGTSHTVNDGLSTAIESTSSGEGYWTVTALGVVQAFGDAANLGGLPGRGITLIPGKGITDMVRTHTDQGYWLVGEDGGVFAFGDAEFSGSLPEQFFKVGNGNYEDYTDIVKDILLWNGWWYRNPTLGDNSPAEVFGNIETTGIYAPEALTEDFFDKKPSIDVINAFKEIVGYINYTDEIGAYHFHTPNIWSIGNFLDTGVPTTRMLSIDEKKQIIDYQTSFNDTDARSKIIIATEDPAEGLPETKSVSLVSQWGSEVLRGVVRPALWVNGKFLTKEIQTTMAHLIDLHLFMQQRQGSLNMPANPLLQINDQVRVYERSSSDTYIHYVRGYSTSMNLETGEYTQSLQLHWMGDGTAWGLVYGAEPYIPPGEPGGGDVAPTLVNYNPPDGDRYASYYYRFTATGTPNPTFVYTTGTLPDGLVLNNFTGVLSGTPTAAGTYEFTMTAQNGVGAVSNQVVNIVIGIGTSGVAPSFQNQTPHNGTVGTLYMYEFTASGSPAPTFSHTAGTLPTGLSISSVGLLSGTPTTNGTFSFTIQASNTVSPPDTASVVVIISTAGGGGSSPPTSGGYFSVLGVGATLPSDAAAAAAVNSSTWEPRPGNNTPNHTIVSNTLGTDTPDFDSTWNSIYLPKVTGNFTGTTDEIIQWAAYKWGWSDELVRAQLIQESDWDQYAVGDFEPASNGHRVYDRTDDPSPTSFSICQNRWYYHPPIVALGGVVTSSSASTSSYPKVVQSTAFALDWFLCNLRGIYDGHSTYLNGGGMAGSGDYWGAIGAWYSGGWHDSAANSYIASVQGHFNDKPWLDSGF